MGALRNEMPMTPATAFDRAQGPVLLAADRAALLERGKNWSGAKRRNDGTRIERAYAPRQSPKWDNRGRKPTS